MAFFLKVAVTLGLQIVRVDGLWFSALKDEAFIVCISCCFCSIVSSTLLLSLDWCQLLLFWYIIEVDCGQQAVRWNFSSWCDFDFLSCHNRVLMVFVALPRVSYFISTYLHPQKADSGEFMRSLGRFIDSRSDAFCRCGSIFCDCFLCLYILCSLVSNMVVLKVQFTRILWLLFKWVGERDCVDVFSKLCLFSSCDLLALGEK